MLALCVTVLWVALKKRVAVGELEHDGGEDDGAGDVIHAVLLECHGAHADQDREDRGRTLHQTPMLRGRDVLRAENSDGDADRVIAVNAREDVRAGVGTIEPGDDPREDVFRRVEDGPEIRAVREDRTDNQADRHAAEQEGTEAVEIIPVLKHEVQNRDGDISKPQHVRDDEILTEWNFIIECCMHDMEADLMIDRLFKVAEPGNIDQRIRQNPCVTIALYKLFDFIHPLASGTFYVRIQVYPRSHSRRTAELPKRANSGNRSISDCCKEWHIRILGEFRNTQSFTLSIQKY